MRFQTFAFAFALTSETHRSTLFTSRFDTFATVLTKTSENDRIARCDVNWTLCARACDILYHSFSWFWCVLDRFRSSIWYPVYIRYVLVFGLIHFQDDVTRYDLQRRFLAQQIVSIMVGTMLWIFKPMTHQYCNAVLHQKSLLRIVLCNITFRAFSNRCVSTKSLGVLMWVEGLNASKCMRFKVLTY